MNNGVKKGVNLAVGLGDNRFRCIQGPIPQDFREIRRHVSKECDSLFEIRRQLLKPGSERSHVNICGILGGIAFGGRFHRKSPEKFLSLKKGVKGRSPFRRRLRPMSSVMTRSFP
jgi:hypothetical protein